MKSLFKYFSIIILIISCKKATINGSTHNEKINNKVIEKAKPKLNSSKKENSQINTFKKKIDSTKRIESEAIDINKVPNIQLPLGSSIIKDYLFPKEFGHVFTDENHDLDISLEKYSKAYQNNFSFYNLNRGIKLKDDFFIENNFSRYSTIIIRQKDSIINNIYGIGKINLGEFNLILKKTHMSMRFSNFKVIALTVIDKNLRTIDELKLFSSISNNGLQDLELFYFDKNKVITKKDFFNAEGEVSFLSEKKYRISKIGKFIRYYNTDGVYETHKEKGLIKNNTREGKWIEKKELKVFIAGADNFCFVESNYKDEIAIGTWNYYKLTYKKDLRSGLPIFKTATKGKLLYTESYKNGEIVKREFVK